MPEKCLIKVFDDFFEGIDGKIEINTNYSIKQMSSNMYLLTVAVPGYKKSNLKIIIQNGALIIRGVLNKFKEANSKYIHDGLVNTSFENSFSLNNRLNLVAANLSNGLLHIVLKDVLVNN